MTNPIVTVNASQQIAPTPSKLQKTGALISQGATILAPGADSLLTGMSSLTPLLVGSKTLASLTWSGSVVTAATTAPHGFAVGDHVPLTIVGATPAGYNGNFYCTITGASAFTYPLIVNPGSETIPGSYTEEDVGELVAMATTFFAQGNTQAVWVLELGAGNATDGANFLSTWIADNPGEFYSYLVPRYWDGNAAFLALAATFTAVTAKTYFFVTTTLATWKGYTAIKSIFVLIEAPYTGAWSANALTALSFGGGTGPGTVTATTTTAHGVLPGQYFTLAGNVPTAYNGTFLALPGTAGSTLYYALSSPPGAETTLGTLVGSQYASAGVPATEFSCAAPFYDTLNYAPSVTNRVTPLNLAYLYGVTPFPSQGNSALLSTLNNANINVVSTGAQGGISALILYGGHMLDGNPFNYWYAADWAQINGQQAVTAACINGSNNPQNPLYFNQFGINTLQQVLVSTMNAGISYGMILNPTKATTLNAVDFAAAEDAGTYDAFTQVNADPFASYVVENPDDYGNGVYNGLAVSMVPLRGFDSISFNITVSSFAG